MDRLQHMEVANGLQTYSTGADKLDIYYLSCSERVVELDAYCLFLNRNESRHTGSIPSCVVDVALALYIFCE